MHKLIFYTAVLFFLLISVLPGCRSVTDDPVSGATVNDLFGKMIECRLAVNNELPGSGDSAADLSFYEYELDPAEVAGLIREGRLDGHPLFTSGYFGNARRRGVAFAAGWRHFPCREKADSLMLASSFVNLPILGLLDDRNYQSPDNYYCCIDAETTGSCFFILAPRPHKLYLVVRHRG